jgi:hypothetical protein
MPEVRGSQEPFLSAVKATGIRLFRVRACGSVDKSKRSSAFFDSNLNYQFRTAEEDCYFQGFSFLEQSRRNH